jgi:L-ascorbate metabolism protein UlaG (beta-lactamase superfamily)
VVRDEEGRCKFLGYIAKLGGFTFYHSGDTLMHEGLVPALAPFAPDITFVPINGNKPERRVAGNLDGSEAAELAHAINAQLAIPHHFDMFEFNTADPELFEAECQRVGQGYRVLCNGEGVDL